MCVCVCGCRDPCVFYGVGGPFGGRLEAVRRPASPHQRFLGAAEILTGIVARSQGKSTAFSTGTHDGLQATMGCRMCAQAVVLTRVPEKKGDGNCSSRGGTNTNANMARNVVVTVSITVTTTIITTVTTITVVVSVKNAPPGPSPGPPGPRGTRPPGCPAPGVPGPRGATPLRP